jgi:hypothetical protein
MTDADLDRRLGAMLREPSPAGDPAFVDRVLAGVRLEAKLLKVRRWAWRRALLDCTGAIVVAASFYLLTQAQSGSADGMISLYGPAMAGLVMLGLWSLVSLPATGTGWRTA